MNTRYLFLDNLRALLMVLGLVLHTCAAFSVEQYWIITYSTPLSWAYGFADAIHLFRMPLFFMISGFFAFTLLKKQAVIYFCKTKLIRIGVPLVSVLVFINIPQLQILRYVSTQNAHSFINVGEVVGHLWFLVNLLAYFWVYSAIHHLVARIKIPTRAWCLAMLIGTALLIIPIGHLCLLALNKVGIPIYAGIPIVGSIFKLFAFFDYFVIGVFIGLISHEKTRLVISSVSSGLIVLLLGSISLLPWLAPALINVVTEPYIAHIQAVFVSLVIWWLAISAFSGESKWFKKLAKASYSIYLFHHGIIVLIVYGLNALNQASEFEIPSYVAFTIVLVLSFFITMAIHFLFIEKSRILQFMFNGK